MVDLAMGTDNIHELRQQDKEMTKKDVLDLLQARQALPEELLGSGIIEKFNISMSDLRRAAGTRKERFS